MDSSPAVVSQLVELCDRNREKRFEALGLTRKQSVLLIFFLASTLGLSAILLKDATPREAVLILIQAACILAIVAVLEGVGRWRPRS